MSDLRERMSQLDRLPVGGEWREIRSRAPRTDLNIEWLDEPSRSAWGRLAAGVVAFVVFVAAITFAWEARRSGPSPASSPTSIPPSMLQSPLPSGGPGTDSLAGVPFPVCRPASIAGTFGGGGDVAWTFAEERVPGGGCEGKPGTQFVAIGTADGVDRMSEGTTPVWGVEGWWAPYAAPDIDRDGIDEIVVATDYPGPGWAIQVWLFADAEDAVVPIVQAAGGSVVQWSTLLGQGRSEDGSTNINGLYCGAISSAPDRGNGLVMWQVSSNLPTRVYATLWTPLNGDLGARYSTTYNVQGPAEYPPTGERSICGSPSHQPPES